MYNPRLLAITPRPIWPIRDGLALRTHYVLETLSRTWDISLITAHEVVGNSGENATPAVAVAQHTRVQLDGRWRTHPGQYSTTPLVRAAEKTMAETRPAVALLWPGSEFLAWTVPGFPAAVADRVDCLALTAWRSMRSAKLHSRIHMIRELAAMARYESRIARYLTATIVVGGDDASALRKISSSSRIHIVPNGVVSLANRARPASANPTVVFTGTLYYPPNVNAVIHLARKIWPSVLSCIPNALLIIAGRNPVPAVTELGESPGITIRANVESMEEVLRSAWVAAAPMIDGAGIKNKVLEAWGCGIPVVMSQLATNGLQLPPGHADLVTNDPKKFSARLIDLLRAHAKREWLGTEAWYFTRAHYTWAEAGRRISRLLLPESN